MAALSKAPHPWRPVRSPSDRTTGAPSWRRLTARYALCPLYPPDRQQRVGAAVPLSTASRPAGGQLLSGRVSATAGVVAALGQKSSPVVWRRAKPVLSEAAKMGMPLWLIRVRSEIQGHHGRHRDKGRVLSREVAPDPGIGYPEELLAVLRDPGFFMPGTAIRGGHGDSPWPPALARAFSRPAVAFVPGTCGSPPERNDRHD